MYIIDTQQSTALDNSHVELNRGEETGRLSGYV